MKKTACVTLFDGERENFQEEDIYMHVLETSSLTTC